MNENKLRRLFAHASESFIKANRDRVDDSGAPHKPESVDRQEIRQTQRNEALGAQYRLLACEIVYFCGHGQKLDDDNAEYAACKPINDAIVNLGIARDDKDFKTQAAQRMDKDQTNF